MYSDGTLESEHWYTYFMDESENQNVEEPQPKIDTPFKKHFYTVTPLSKYLAMALFIALPFLGFWVGLRVQVNTETNSNIELKTDTGSQVKVTKEGDEDNNISSEKTNFNSLLNQVEKIIKNS